ncbi:MAG: hypothetical protein P1U56_20400 [Saprospiraceae bacterium]|nr:hypothetical protein [Saprospiraceae bacterium]
MNSEMKKDNQAKDKNGIIEIMIWMLPAIMLSMMAKDIGGKTPEIVMSMILGGLGASIGFPLFWLTKDKSMSVKYGTFVFTVIGLIGIMAFILNNRTESDKRNLITCQICGYKAVEKKGGQCDVCIAQINDNFKDEEGYVSMEELIKEEQLYFFSMEENITFKDPEVYKDLDFKYLKDKNWKPIVSKKEVEIRRKEMEEIGKHIKVEVKKVN